MADKTESFVASNAARAMYWGRSQIVFRHRRGEQMPCSKVTESDVREIRKLIAGGAKIRDVAKRFGVSHTTISRIVTRRSWRHVN